MDWPSNYWEWGAYLLHQQCWCWGQDIRRPQGNLLLDYGFERTRTPAGMEGSTRYTLREDSFAWFLWGFGMAFAEVSRGAIYVNRYQFIPLWMESGEPLHQVWQVNQLAGLLPPSSMGALRRTRRLLKLLLRRVARYERWVLEREGVAWRRMALRDWHRPAILPERMPLEWERLSWRVEEPPLAAFASVTPPDCLDGRI